MREISMWKYPQGFFRERRWKYLHRQFSFISPEFPQGNYEEISTRIIPQNSPMNPCGNLGEVDGSPAAQQAKSRGFCRESLGMVDPWWRGIPGEIWVVSETRIHREIEGKFPR